MCDPPIYGHVHSNIYVHAKPSVSQHHLKTAMLPKSSLASKQMLHALTFAQWSHMSPAPPTRYTPNSVFLLPYHCTPAPQLYSNMTIISKILYRYIELFSEGADRGHLSSERRVVEEYNPAFFSTDSALTVSFTKMFSGVAYSVSLSM